MEWRVVIPPTPALAMAGSLKAWACWWQELQLTVLLRDKRLS
jgi:hypothetical protein